MTNINQYNHNQICTKDNMIKVGKNYQYKEDCFIVDVKILDNTSNDEQLEFKLEVVNDYGCDKYPKVFSKGNVFTVSAACGNYAYSGMWRLYDLDIYAVKK